jgi:hypothetical protein
MNHRIARLLCLAGFLLVPVFGHAATIVVDTLDDRSDRKICSLRSALNAATLDRPVDACRAGEPGSDRVVFATTLKGRLDLRSVLDVESSVRIEAPAPGQIVLGGAIISIVTDGTAEIRISGLEFRTGLLVRSVAELTLDRLRFVDIVPQMSRASALQIHGPNVGRVTIRDSQFYGNSGQWAPVVVHAEADLIELELAASRFSGNEGTRAGAVYLETYRPMLARVVDSDFYNNHATAFGAAGAIAVEGPANLTFEGSTFARNHAQGAGALSSRFGSGLSVRHSVFERNEAMQASALLVEQLSPLIYPADISFATFVDNGFEAAAPALVNLNGAEITLRANLMRAGSASICGPGPFRSAGFNLELAGNSCSLGSSGDRPYAFADLVRVQLPGRYPAPTTEPRAFDTAIDQLPPGECDDANGFRVDRDLAGRTRPFDFASGQPGGPCDIGAVELRTSDPYFAMP